MPFEVILSGHVQGVGCRWYCSRVGQIFKLHGTATNLDDGTVQILLETEDTDLAEAYASVLKENRFDLSFWGKIESAEVSRITSFSAGEYSW
jgi:acylphosphatase